MDKPTTPRRPLVPGPPAPSGIAAKAVALREMREKGIIPTLKTEQPQEQNSFTQVESPMDWERRQQEKRMSLPIDAPLYRVPGPVGNLAKGIAGVMSECGTIQKTGYNKFHNYHYATLQDLLFAITPLMGKHGVVVIQNEVERSLAENRIMVTYEFSIFHTSNEVWPERPRFTGMSIGRNSKGEYDDKAINKCHSAARKYFLLSLFQVPSGDFDDADAGPGQSASAPQQPATAKRPSTVPGPAMPLKQPEIDERVPHKITLPPGSGADQWAKKYIDAIKAAETEEELVQWDAHNSPTLQMLSEKFAEVYKQIDEAYFNCVLEVAPLTIMPDPKNDATEALNWVAQQLASAATYERAETFWNKAVAPHEDKFEPEDWELLMTEWRRAELRLNPDQEPESA
jgi:ERF superfamily